jgi:FixJ family two-component response regulator
MTGATVHVIDDDPRMLRAVSRLLRSYDYEVQTCTSSAEILTQKVPSGTACLVLDLKMPEISGLDVQQVLAKADEYLPIIFVSGQADVASSVQAMKAGAIDFLIKPFNDAELIAAVQTALDRSQKAQEQRHLLSRDQEAFDSLTPREREVCLGIAQGLLNKQVGYELGTTEKTVKAQRARVMQKLGAGSLADVVRLVERLRSAGAILPALAQSRR